MALDVAALLRHLHSAETTFVERKRVSDTQDFAKNVVAYANSLRPDEEGVLFIGATDKGEIEDHKSSLDQMQKTFIQKTRDIYPEPPYYYTVEVSEENRSRLAVVVPGGRLKPYFAGPPYLRVLSTSAKATTAQYEQLLASRSDKAYELQQWIGRSITVKTFVRRVGIHYQIDERENEAVIEGCNQFYLTVRLNNRLWSYSLNKLDLAYDHPRNRLQIEREANS